MRRLAEPDVLDRSRNGRRGSVLLAAGPCLYFRSFVAIFHMSLIHIILSYSVVVVAQPHAPSSAVGGDDGWIEGRGRMEGGSRLARVVSLHFCERIDANHHQLLQVS